MQGMKGANARRVLALYEPIYDLFYELFYELSHDLKRQFCHGAQQGFITHDQ